MKSFNIPKTWLAKTKLSIVLIGAGGTGSAVLSQLYQMDKLFKKLDLMKLNITVYDPDTVSEPNIGRQQFWDSDLSLKKSDVLVARFNNFGEANMKSIPTPFSMKDLARFSGDILINCSDSVSLRQDIGDFIDKHSLDENRQSALYLDTGNGEHSGQIVLGTLFKGECDSLLPCVHELYPDLAKLEDNNTESCSTFAALLKQNFGVNAKVAIEAVTLLFRLLHNHKITRHGAIIDIKHGYTTPIEINEQQWKMLGMRSQRPIFESKKKKN